MEGVAERVKKIQEDEEKRKRAKKQADDEAGLVLGSWYKSEEHGVGQLVNINLSRNNYEFKFDDVRTSYSSEDVAKLLTPTEAPTPSANPFFNPAPLLKVKLCSLGTPPKDAAGWASARCLWCGKWNEPPTAITVGKYEVIVHGERARERVLLAQSVPGSSGNTCRVCTRQYSGRGTRNGWKCFACSGSTHEACVWHPMCCKVCNPGGRYGNTPGKCAGCEGTGKGPCLQCNGAGRYRSSVWSGYCCSACGGKGKMVYNSRSDDYQEGTGFGVLVCKNCKGRGYCHIHTDAFAAMLSAQGICYVEWGLQKIDAKSQGWSELRYDGGSGAYSEVLQNRKFNEV